MTQSTTVSASRVSAKQDAIETVTADTFTQLILEGQGPIVVEFMSYGCAHCRVMEPVLQKVAEALKSDERIFRVNIALAGDLAERYQIEGTPTMLMFLNGNVISRVEGPHPTVSSVTEAVTRPFQS